MNRIVPQIPDGRIRILIDTDAGTEIDDLYAIALALASEDKFKIEGFIASHFATKAGPESIDKSYEAVVNMLKLAGKTGVYDVVKGVYPMQFPKYPSKGEGVDFLIQKALEGSENDPLWVICLGAATNLASAVLANPSICHHVRFVFHARSEYTWPERSVQYNVKGDILAARTLLESSVPLVWFDTGTHLTCPYEETAKYLASSGKLGRFLHEFRDRNSYYKSPEKGFFDLADIVWLLRPGLCESETVPAPSMDHCMFFDHKAGNGTMLRVYDIEREASWRLFFDRMAAANL